MPRPTCSRCSRPPESAPRSANANGARDGIACAACCPASRSVGGLANLAAAHGGDLRAVGELAKVNGDLGRVAGLLKLWLAEKRGQGARPTEAMMRDFRKLQDELTGIMSRAVRGY